LGKYAKPTAIFLIIYLIFLITMIYLTYTSGTIGPSIDYVLAIYLGILVGGAILLPIIFIGILAIKKK